MLVWSKPIQGQWLKSWPTELIAGGVVELSVKGPWISDGYRKSAVKRLALSTGISLTYEYIVEPANRQNNAGRWQDVGQRLVGTLGAEVLFALGSKLAKAFR
jgi:hypothetical protein